MQVMSASKTSFQLVTIAMGQGCPPVTLLRMSQASGSITLVLRQVQAELCPSVTLGQFRLTANRQRTATIKSLEGPDCLWVFKYGATKAHSHVVSVISLPTAIGACKAHGVHPLTLSGLESLRHQGQYTILQTPEHILKLNCTPDVNPPSQLVPLPLPSSLPLSPVQGPACRQRYSLLVQNPHLARSVVLTQQITELKTWATTPIQLNRKGPPLQEVSWQNLLSNMWLFLGFCWKWMRVQQPCLQHFLSPHLVASFISFHIAMEHCSSTIKQHVSTALKVLAWWATKPGGHDLGLQKMSEEWLPNLSGQISRALPKPVKTASSLPSAQTLLCVIEQQRLALLAAFKDEGMSGKLARSIHDLTLVSTVFGHLPPIRLSCIRYLKVPGYEGPCHKSDCVHGPSCHGNLLRGCNSGPLSLYLPHHKNEASWGRAAIRFQLPQELTELMSLHLSQGHTLLTEYMGNEEQPHVFVDYQARPFTDSNFTIYWGRIMRAYGLQDTISPSQCRQVFVHERRSAERVEGPSDKGAAMVMGHSPKQWDKWYDLDFHARHAQQAVDAMATWRNNLLSSQALSAATTSAPQLQQSPNIMQPSLESFESPAVNEEDEEVLYDDEDSGDEMYEDEDDDDVELATSSDHDNVDELDANEDGDFFVDIED